jgi:ABC-2 type transport system ATP-binding protein
MLLLDEPTVGVDPVSRRELWAIVRELLEKGELGVLVATSYLDEAERCEQVVLLDGGVLLDYGPPQRFADALAGRVFELLPGRDVPPRRVQVAVAMRPGVVDATVRSGRIRVVLGEGGAAVDPLAELDDVSVAERRAARPDFGDAFMARLAARHSAVAVPVVAHHEGGGGRDDVVVAVHDLRKRFGAFEAVRGVSFEVRRGEIFGLLGPNGAGKSTTFRMLCGLTSVSAGEATVAGADLRRAGRRVRARLGYMAQKFSLYGTLTVAQNLRFFGVAYGLSGARLRERIGTALAAFGLEARRDEPAADLTAGFKQRLAMAAALLHEPELLFLDEPTSGVDPIARREFWRRINATALAGTTVIVTTHFMEEAEYCDRMLIMARGAELAMGTPAEIRALARTQERPDPTIEDAFVVLAQRREPAAA